jgi:hypothetical protein
MPQMHAREAIKHILIAKKMRHWQMVARYPLFDLRCPSWRARKNFWHLRARYPEIAAKLGLTELSVYGP